MAARMGIGRHVGLRLVPQLRQHLAHRGGPGLRGTPPLKFVHQAPKLVSVHDPISLLLPIYQFCAYRHPSRAASAFLTHPRRGPSLGLRRLSAFLSLHPSPSLALLP
jgi:hypothetical protein